jgi:acetyltransferase-like isoleucine patch superfamily enzyme
MRTHNGQFLGRAKLESLGIRCGGDDIRVHTSVVIIAPEQLRLGNHVRVDPFSLLSATGEISLGNHVHIGSHCTLIGWSGIRVEDFAGISHGSRLFSATDDFGGSCLTGPTVPEDLRQVRAGPIHLRKHAVIGSGAVVLPGATLGEGAILGALSLLRGDLPAWQIWSGVPARYLRDRQRDLLRLAEEIVADPSQSGA